MPLLDGTTQEDYYGGNDHGNYQFTSLNNIIDNFIAVYVGDGKIINKVSRIDVAFHAQRAMQELSFDTFKSCKSQEITLPPSLTMILPQDYVNYVKISWSGSDGIKRVLYPAIKTSNPTSILQNSDGDYVFDAIEGTLIENTNSSTWENYSSPASEDDDTDVFPLIYEERYGIDPQHSQTNGSFFIDCKKGLIHFSSNINGKTVILDYISDSLGTYDEMKVHKFAEEAVYKYLSHAVLSTKMGVPEYVVARYKKEKRAATRQAKLRLSNIKLEEITQILRGKSKHLKH
jgi:hypothetical protein